MTDDDRVSTQQLPARLCGRCTVCCVVMRVDAYHKAAHTACPHLGRRGCTNYLQRHEQCRAWHCLWRVSRLPDVWRPDKSGVILDVAETAQEIGAITLPQTQVVIAYETKPAGFNTRPAQLVLRHFAVQQQLVVLRTHDGRRLFLGPVATVRIVHEFLHSQPEVSHE